MKSRWLAVSGRYVGEDHGAPGPGEDVARGVLSWVGRLPMWGRRCVSCY